MASKSTELPEGTDTIIAGASGASSDPAGGGVGSRAPSGGGSSSGGASSESTSPGSVAEKLRAQAAEIGSQTSAKVVELRGQATDQIFSFAAQGKDRATEALDGAAKLIGDAAAQVEEKLGGPAGNYARQAAEAVSGFATTLRSKEVEDLIDDARTFVKRSPALAVGAAAAAGFVLSRVIKAGSATLESAAQSLDTDKGAGKPGGGADNSKA